jgi:hypothetical protein
MCFLPDQVESGSKAWIALVSKHGAQRQIALGGMDVGKPASQVTV